MGRISYQNLKRQKEAARKHRQQNKQERRTRKDTADAPAVEAQSPATAASLPPATGAGDSESTPSKASQSKAR